MALVEELRAEISTLMEDDPSRGKDISKKLKKSSIAIAKKGVPIALRVLTSGLLNIDEKSEDQISELVSEIAKERVDEYSRRKNSIGGFKKTLKDLVSVLSKGEGSEKPLVIFIDELDRCRPPYAISLLEHAKHLFSVPGIVFVISVDRTQLSNSICAVYGERFDADGYLRRFIDLDFVLPDPPGKDFVHHLFETMGIFDLLDQRNHHKADQEKKELYDLLNLILPPLGLSLRTQIHIFSRIKIVMMTTQEGHRIFSKELALLTVLREWNQPLFEEFISGTVDPKEIIDVLENASGGSIFLNRPGWFLEGYILAMGAEVGRISPLIQTYKNRTKDGSADQFHSREKRAVDVYNQIRKMEETGTFLRATASRIAFSDRFLNHRNS
ncbi:MAG: hypothetical protein DRR06_18275 [Gammaproteobacteria bacterium]|nr:MAG: hypothetical protein DRR06_18275 [Gammaproteobacteria bacterium]